jgi:hypothetical protein
VLLNRVDDAMRYALEPIPGVRKAVHPKKSTKPIRASKPEQAALKRRKPSKLAKR